MTTKRKTKTARRSLRRMVSTEFRDKAKTFGKADAKTQAHRDAVNRAGFAVEFHSGMTDAEAVRILQSPETKRILRSTN
jgi:hypothetical protein